MTDERPSEVVGAESWPCYEEGCEFIGKNERSLQMHTMRKHSDDPRWVQGTRVGLERAQESRKSKAAERRASRRRPTIPELQELAQPAATAKTASGGQISDEEWQARAAERPASRYQPPQPCVICGRQITMSRMRAHLRRVHNATVPDRPRPPIQQRRNELPRTPLTSGSTPVTSTSRERPRGFVANPQFLQPEEVRELQETEPAVPIVLNLERFRVVGEDGEVLLLVADGRYWKLEPLT